MRSVRALDVLFTAQSAVNLLSRVATSQASKLCSVRREPIQHGAPQAASNEYIQKETVVNRTESAAESLNAARTTLTNIQEVVDASTEQHRRQGSPLSSKLLQLKDNAPELSRQNVRERYSKPPSALFKTIDPTLIEETKSVSCIDSHWCALTSCARNL
jgi:hypothetical protein